MMRILVLGCMMLVLLVTSRSAEANPDSPIGERGSEASPTPTPLPGFPPLGPDGNGQLLVAVVITLNGTMGEQFECSDDGADCYGIGKYRYVFDGALATVTDADMKELKQSPFRYQPDASSEHQLVFAALLVIPELDQYTVQFSIISPFPFSRADIEQGGWTVSLTLGEPVDDGR